MKKIYRASVFSQHPREAENRRMPGQFSAPRTTPRPGQLSNVQALKTAHSQTTMALCFTVYKPYSTFVISLYSPPQSFQVNIIGPVIQMKTWRLGEVHKT